MKNMTDNNKSNNTTIMIDRTTHAKIKRIQNSLEKKEERPVSIKEIIRNMTKIYIESIKG